MAIQPNRPNRFTRTRVRPIQTGRGVTTQQARTVQPAQPQPGGPFVPRPDLGPNVGFGVGLPQPQLEAMPYTGATPVTAAQEILSQPGIQNAIGTMPGIAGGIVNQLQQNQDPNAQQIGNVLQTVGGLAQPIVNTMGGAFGLGNAGGKSAPAQPGGPFVPRPDLGPNVGFGVGLPQPDTQPQLEAMPYDGNNMGSFNQPNYVPTQATQQNPNVSIGFGGKSAPSKLPGSF